MYQNHSLLTGALVLEKAKELKLSSATETHLDVPTEAKIMQKTPEALGVANDTFVMLGMLHTHTLLIFCHSKPKTC